MKDLEAVAADKEAVELTENAVLGLSQKTFDSVKENPDGSLEIVEPEKKDDDDKLKDKEEKPKEDKPKEKDESKETDIVEPSGKTDKPEKATEKDTEKGKESEKSDEETQDGQPKPDEEETEDRDKDFQDKVNDKVQNLAEVYKTDKERKKFLEDLDNHPKFFASNTQKAMEIAEERKTVDALVKRIGAPELVEAIEAFDKSTDKEDVLKSLDDWYDAESSDPSKNPVRKVFDQFSKSVPEVQGYSTEKKELADEKGMLEVEKELIGLKQIKDSPFDYSNDEELKKTIDFADEYAVKTGNFINLDTAHRIRSLDAMSSQIDSQKEKIVSLKKELKERNEEVKKLKSDKKIEPTDETTASGKTAKRETYKDQPKDDKELMNRMSSDFDALMNE